MKLHIMLLMLWLTDFKITQLEPKWLEPKWLRKYFNVEKFEFPKNALDVQNMFQMSKVFQVPWS